MIVRKTCAFFRLSHPSERFCLFLLSVFMSLMTIWTEMPVLCVILTEAVFVCLRMQPLICSVPSHRAKPDTIPDAPFAQRCADADIKREVDRSTLLMIGIPCTGNRSTSFVAGVPQFLLVLHGTKATRRRERNATNLCSSYQLHPVVRNWCTYQRSLVGAPDIVATTWDTFFSAHRRNWQRAQSKLTWHTTHVSRMDTHRS